MELLVAPQNSITSQLLLLVSFSPPRSESASQAIAWHGMVPAGSPLSCLRASAASGQVKASLKLSSSEALLAFVLRIVLFSVTSTLALGAFLHSSLSTRKSTEDKDKRKAARHCSRDAFRFRVPICTINLHRGSYLQWSDNCMPRICEALLGWLWLKS